MSLERKIIVGLADPIVGKRVANAIQHVTGSASALTVGGDGTELGFFGATPAARPTITYGNVTSVCDALLTLGLVLN